MCDSAIETEIILKAEKRHAECSRRAEEEEEAASCGNKESDSVTRGHICLNFSLRYLMNVKVAVSSLEVRCPRHLI